MWQKTIQNTTQNVTENYRDWVTTNGGAKEGVGVPSPLKSYPSCYGAKEGVGVPSPLKWYPSCYEWRVSL
jgi:hypothetical protein